MHKSKYKHIIWDYNGTLVDDTWLCVEIVNEFLSRDGKPSINEETYRRKYDLPVIDFYKEIGFDLEYLSYDELSSKFIKIYDERRFECSLQLGIRQVLQAVRQAGIPQSVLSAYQRHRLESALDYYGLSQIFAYIAGLNDYYAHGKIEIGRNLVKSLNCLPEQILLVGDTAHDCEVARETGTDCVLLPIGHHTRGKLSAYPAQIIEHPTQLIESLGL